MSMKQSHHGSNRRSRKSSHNNPRKILNNYVSRDDHNSMYQSRNKRSSKKSPISKNRNMGSSFSKHNNRRSGSKKSRASKNDLLNNYMKNRSPYSRSKKEDLYQSMDRGMNNNYNSINKRSKSRPNMDMNFSSLDDRRHKSRNMILESTMERKNLKESIMKRYRDSRTRGDSRSKEGGSKSKSKKRSSMYQNFMNKRVSASKGGSRADMRNWSSTDSSAWKKRSRKTKKSELVDKLLNSSYSSAFKTHSGIGMRKAKSGMIYHSHDNDK